MNTPRPNIDSIENKNPLLNDSKEVNEIENQKEEAEVPRKRNIPKRTRSIVLSPINHNIDTSLDDIVMGMESLAFKEVAEEDDCDYDIGDVDTLIGSPIQTQEEILLDEDLFATSDTSLEGDIAFNPSKVKLEYNEEEVEIILHNISQDDVNTKGKCEEIENPNTPSFKVENANNESATTTKPIDIPKKYRKMLIIDHDVEIPKEDLHQSWISVVDKDGREEIMTEYQFSNWKWRMEREAAAIRVQRRRREDASCNAYEEGSFRWSRFAQRNQTVHSRKLRNSYPNQLDRSRDREFFQEEEANATNEIEVDYIPEDYYNRNAPYFNRNRVRYNFNDDGNDQLEAEID